MEGEEARKAGKPSSRIPTFQSSLARKRTTTQIAESQLPSKPEGSSRECLMKEKGIGSGETLRTKLPLFGDRETALPVLSTRIHSHSTDDLSVTGVSDPILSSETSEAASLPPKRNHSPEPSDSESLEESLHRPSLRVATESPDTDSTAEPPAEPQDASTMFQSQDKQESDTVTQDDLKQGHSEVIQGIGDQLEERLGNEMPAASVIEDARKQCSALKETEKLLMDVSSETILKQNDEAAPARNKTVHSRQAEHQKSTSSRVRHKLSDTLWNIL